MGGKRIHGVRVRTEYDRAASREYNRKQRQLVKEMCGWQKLLGLPKEISYTRMCLRPERKPGQAPDCADARETAPKPISLPSIPSLRKPLPCPNIPTA